jgi:NAD+ diphosphatase
MIGCKAITADEHLDIDYTELEDARWFTRDQVKAALNGDPDAELGLPPEHAIGGYMVRQWAEEKI